MPKYTGINHLAMVTGDMDATIRFWRDLLKMRLIAGIGRPGYRHYFLEISDQDMIAFFEWPDVQPLEERDHGFPIPGQVAFDHISFGVDSDDDLWEIKDALEAADFWCSEVVDHGFIHSIYAFDPNNIPIEFSASVAGVDLRSTPVMVDTSPSSEAQKGVNPQPGVWPKVTRPTPINEREIYEGEGQDVLDALQKKG
ncbi:VOC family protein [Pseudodesulfovibrio sp. JC047]|uniref:VOC family protein n=1 Tax=Pseudodesulfovibrio sp. JC047 TaxID=2683199 RepID=UPI0013D1262D|nr:VOC family protein [Pseudodesulfovibrio sp. JC047]NDV18243.1 VOC family protein [Pseudodesulfovibrio sp. JC047]